MSQLLQMYLLSEFGGHRSYGNEDTNHLLYLAKSSVRRLDPPYWKIRHIGIIDIGDDKIVQPILKPQLNFSYRGKNYNIFLCNLVNKFENTANGKTDLFPWGLAYVSKFLELPLLWWWCTGEEKHNRALF